jgi:hypothetical protein
LFKRTGTVWALQRTLVGSAAVGGDLYGYCVDLYCSVAVVGAPGDNAGQGTAYFHTTTEAVPVYRFYNTKTGTHFYTASEAEKSDVLAKWPSIFTLEGVAYSVSLTPRPGMVSVYRFYNATTGAHFYTAGEAEKANVLAKYPQFSLEGVAFYVLP